MKRAKITVVRHDLGTVLDLEVRQMRIRGGVAVAVTAASLVFVRRDVTA